MSAEGLLASKAYPNVLAAALGYIRLGWSVFPCRYHGKEPLTPHGFLDATRDERVACAWWRRWPGANIGVRCGSQSAGLTVLDVDGEEGKTSVSGNELPVTPTARTGNEGLHYYYRSQVVLRPKVGLLPHVDLRAQDSYVIAPCSVHPNGKSYEWLVSPRETTLANLPDWVYEAARRSSATGDRRFERDIAEGASMSKDFDGGRSPAWRYILQAIPEGERNATLVRVAGWLRLYHPPHVVEAIMQAVNLARCSPPLDEKEIAAIVRSVFNYPQPGVNGHPKAAVPRYVRLDSNDG